MVKKQQWKLLDYHEKLCDVQQFLLYREKAILPRPAVISRILNPFLRRSLEDFQRVFALPIIITVHWLMAPQGEISWRVGCYQINPTTQRGQRFFILNMLVRPPTLSLPQRCCPSSPSPSWWSRTRWRCTPSSDTRAGSPPSGTRWWPRPSTSSGPRSHGDRTLHPKHPRRTGRGKCIHCWSSFPLRLRLLSTSSQETSLEVREMMKIGKLMISGKDKKIQKREFQSLSSCYPGREL